MEQNDIFGTEYVVMDESLFIFATAGEGALTSCKQSDIFCEIDKGAARLFDGCLQLAEETFCKIFQTAEENVIWNLMKLDKLPPDLEEEGDLTGLTTIWSRRKPVCPPRLMEDFF